MAGEKRFVVVSGLPASGKSTLGASLARALGWPFLDKDDFLESLFEEHECPDAAARQRLSRIADERLRREALRRTRAVLCSHWRRPESPARSGTPTDWLRRPDLRILEIVCECPLEVAAARFRERTRHPGHHDGSRTDDALREQFDRLTAEYPLRLGVVLELDASRPIDAGAVAGRIGAWIAAE